MSHLTLRWMGQALDADVELRSPRAVLKREGRTIEATVRRSGSWIEIEAGGRTLRCAALATSQGVWVGLEGRTYFLERRHREAAAAEGPRSADEIRAPMTGRVASVAAVPGAEVREGDLLLTIEAMKMEFKLTAPEDGLVREVLCSEGDRVDLSQLLVTLDPKAAP